MHKYLKAVGFSALKKSKDTDMLVDEAIKNADEKRVVELPDGRCFTQFFKEFFPDCGISVCGEYNESDEFHTEYYFPYLKGSAVSSSEDVIIERQSDREAYIGACDDMRLDISLIFHLVNNAEYLESKNIMGQMEKINNVSLSGLSIDGKVLLPVLKNEDYTQERQKKVQKRAAMIIAARNGDEQAIENLTVEDMDMYDEINRRSHNEDIYSIVDNCFMPYGFGSDIYSIIADIKGFEEYENNYTGEEVYKLELVCNEIGLDIVINKKDMLGEPMAGRRFKGIIWLQGNVAF